LFRPAAATIANTLELRLEIDAGHVDKLRCDRQNLIQLLGETSGAAILDAVLALEFALTLGSVARSSTTSANGACPIPSGT